ncbi:MAG TPA: hypothetical protein VNM48_13400 [Chloroflexota bacterium]|nr:hypothetical protein [Chloroflexota bacterium]
MPEFFVPDIWVKGGLLAPDHRKAMGVSLWLYLYILRLVRFDGPGAGQTPKERPYRHTDAAAAMGVDVRSIKREFEHLADTGYIGAARTRYGLHVTVNKYVPLSGRIRRHPSRSVTNAPSGPAPEVTKVSSREDRNVTSAPTSEVTEMSTRSDVSVHEKWRFCPEEVTEVSLPYIRSRATTDSTESTVQVGETRAHAREAAHTPESIRLYCHLRQTSLSQTQANAIRATVAEDPESLATWRRAVEACEANGIGKGNVKCALDWHAKGIPEKYRLPGTPGSPGANGQLAARHPAPERPQLTAEQEAASDAARERARAEMTDRGLIGKYAQIGRLPT